MKFRYALDRSSRKFNCPQCNKRHFVRYKDNETGKYLPDHVGRCDREISCAYHYTPKMYFEKHPNFQRGESWEDIVLLPPIKNLNTIPPEYLLKTLGQYKRNNFVQWLDSIFDTHLVEAAIQRYRIGTSKRWTGATVFWQIDRDLKIRQAKVMLYNKITGRRIKEEEHPNPGTGKVFFAGKSILRKLGENDPELCQCFFGEHLLENAPTLTIGIVESEKTAIVMSIFTALGIAGNFVWIATGGKNGCRWSESKVIEVLNERNVVLFPDLGAFNDWSAKARSFENCRVLVSDILEKYACPEDRLNGLDIADYFLGIYLCKNEPSCHFNGLNQNLVTV